MPDASDKPMEFEVDLGELEPLWAEAITKALAGSGIEITVTLKPAAPIKAAHDPTEIVIGGKTTETNSPPVS